MRNIVILPSEIIVQLHDAESQPVPNVLVALDFLWHGNFYYSHSLGLSDVRGQVKTSSDEIRATFQTRQHQFMMDLKVPLAECDSSGVIRIIGGTEFQEYRRGLDPRWISSEWMARWNRAENGRFESHRATVSLDSTDSIRLKVSLQAGRVAF